MSNSGVVVLNPTRSILQDVDGYQVDVVEDSYLETRLKVCTTSRGRPEYDTFGRFRVSNPETIFDSKQDFDEGSFFWETDTTASGSISYVQAQARSELAVSGGATDAAIRQTKRYFHYQAAKSSLLFCTFNMRGGVANVVKSAGLFDDDNGYIFRMNGTTPEFVLRSSTSGSAVDTNKAVQSEWNIDPMDGTGPSGITLDFSKVQIFILDFEWLGVGSVRMGFVVDAAIYYCHQFNHANSIETVYMSTPVLPIRYQIEATGASSATTMDSICCSLISEGGQPVTGFSLSSSRGTSGTTIGTGNAEQIIAIRQKSTWNRLPAFVNAVNLITTSSADFVWWLVQDPTFTGGSASSWVSSNVNSGIEYDITRSGNWNGDGNILDSGYGSTNTEFASSQLNTRPFLYSSIDGTTSSEIVLIAQSLSGNETFYGAITWIEQQ